MPPRAKFTNFQELSEFFAKNLKNASLRPTIYSYVPHEKQVQFHSAPEKNRLYVGGNRAGKTVGGVVEDIWWLIGKHPYRQTPPPPVRGRVVCVDFKQGWEKIIKPEVLRWLPMSELKNGSWEDSFDNQFKTLTLENGSTVEFMSYEQDVDKFAGTSRHFTHFDEEPPKGIFDECKMRLLDTGGSWWMTLTPINGASTFIYDDIYTVGLNKGTNIAVIQVDTEENPHINPIELQDIVLGLSEEEIKIRKQGQFIEIGGRAFKTFRPDIHVTKDIFIPPIDWTTYASLDHGFNNPTAWLYHSVSPKGIVVTWDELYASEVTVPEWVIKLQAKNREDGRRDPDIYIGDPAIKQRSAAKGNSIQTEYAQRGIPIVLGNNDVLLGVNKMNNYLNAPKWFITPNCINLINQMQRLRWQTWSTQKMRDQNNPKETLHKYNDHATDSARYMFSLLPEIQAQDHGPNLKEIARRMADSILTPVAAVPIGGFSIDQVLANSFKPRSTTEWTVVDEYMGGYF